jgi:DNA recombination-dependent growth factor C
MALESGTTTLRRFYTSKSLPHRSNSIWLDKLKEFCIMDAELEQDMENEGWAVLGNELSTEFTEKNTIVGPYIIFSYRCDTHRVAMNVVELHLKSQISLDAENSEVINRQKENDMKDDIIRDLLSQTLPSIEIAGVLVDTHNGVIYYTSGSDRLIDKLCLLFLYTFDISLIEATYETSAARLLDDEDLAASLMTQPGTLLVEDLQLHPDYMENPDSRMGSSFLTWFFYFLQSSESLWVSENIDEIFIQVESELSLAGETFGSREVTIKKGDINNCKELVAAFSAGKRISKLRFLFYRGSEEDGESWTFSIDKKSYAMLSLKVPKPEAVDTFGLKIERFDSICEIHEIIDDIFLDYLNLKTSKGWSDIENDMRIWLRELDQINNPNRVQIKEPILEKKPEDLKENSNVDTKETLADVPTDKDLDSEIISGDLKSDSSISNEDTLPDISTQDKKTISNKKNNCLPNSKKQTKTTKTIKKQPILEKDTQEQQEDSANENRISIPESEIEVDHNSQPYTISQEELDEAREADEE